MRYNAYTDFQIRFAPRQIPHAQSVTVSAEFQTYEINAQRSATDCAFYVLASPAVLYARAADMDYEKTVNS